MGHALVTGGSGFLGRHVVNAVLNGGTDVTVLAREAHGLVETLVDDITQPNIDLGARVFDWLYHVAGLAHIVPRTPEESERFTRVNRDGTHNVLQAVERTGQMPRGVLLVSTVAVYGREQGVDITEDHPREATDPYGVSKAQSEDVVQEWCMRHGVTCGIVRLPLVIGASAPGNFGAMIHSIRNGRYANVGDGKARRSMVIAREAASAFPRIAESGGVFHLTDGHHPSFNELSTTLAESLDVAPPRSVPDIVARALAVGGDTAGFFLRRRIPFNSGTYRKMTTSLTFSDDRARTEIGWASSRVVDHIAEFVE
jgi:GlcNAc-P-P-Und epimerase